MAGASGGIKGGVSYSLIAALLRYGDLEEDTINQIERDLKNNEEKIKTRNKNS